MEYQYKDAECNAIFLATVLNPRFGKIFFYLHYSEYDLASNLLIGDTFKNLVEQSEQREPTPTPDKSYNPDKTNTFYVFGGSNGTSNKPSSLELDDYLQGQYPIKKYQTPLAWWKV